MIEYIALAGRVHESLAEVQTVVDRVKLLSEKALSSGDDGYWDGVALNLYGFYTGVERIFEDIARTIDESMPSGPDWHRDLLMQMSAEVSDIRPSIISRNTRRCLDEYRGFRHVVRNVYTLNLRPSRLQELAEDLTSCYRDVQHDLITFSTFLKKLTGKE